MRKLITLFTLAFAFIMCSNLTAQVGPPPPYSTCDGDTAGAFMPVEAAADADGNFVMYTDGSNAMDFMQMASGGSLPDNSFVFDRSPFKAVQIFLEPCPKQGSRERISQRRRSERT